MISLVSYGGNRPNRVTESKNEDYHARYARYCVYNANNSLHKKYLEKIDINKNFYIGNQWIDEEDLEEFLKDDTGEVRNRLKIVNNVIRPMVEQYRGNAIRMEYNATLKSYSKKAINRRETALAEMMLHFNASQQIPSLKPMLQRRFGVGDTAEETVSIFENSYQDQYVWVINNLCKHVSEINDFNAIKFESAIPLALNGITITEYFEHAGNMRFQEVQPEYFFWDRSGKKADLSDVGYCGKYIPMEPTDIFEQHHQKLEEDHIKAIEKWSASEFATLNHSFGSSIPSNKIPTFYTYWKDSEKCEYGYVKDEYGYEYLTKINYTYPGEDKPRYTNKDVIMVSPEKQKRVLNGKPTKTIYVDVIRYCHFIPNEIMTTQSQFNKKDIILDYGVLAYQETDNMDFHSAKFPFCIYTWNYIDGQVIAPVDDAIDPQRLINRVLSVAENQINNSRGAGTILDKSVFDHPDEESEALRAMNQSRPVTVNARGRGIQNMVGQYDGTIRQGTQVLFNVIDTLNNYTTRMTGVNEALQGQQGGSDQLVGTTQLMIQRGSLMQEPFYNAIAEKMKRMYQAIVSYGKNLYADNERELAIAVGDEGVQIIRISKDMKSEDFRTSIVRENVDEVLINAANNLMMQLKQLDMLDDIRIADLWGRATPSEVGMAMRQYAKEKLEMRRQAIKNQAAQTEDMYNKMATQNKLQGAREEQNQLNNLQSQHMAEQNSLAKTAMETKSKERIAAMSQALKTQQ
jgi:hypothetical protein